MPNDKELWRTVKRFPMYEVSNLGQIRIRGYIARYDDGEEIRVDPVFVPEYVHSTGYKYVFIEGKMYLTHRLVAETWLEGSQTFVRHRDGNKGNNAVENLYWSYKSSDYMPKDIEESEYGRVGKRVLCEATGEVFGSMKMAAAYCGIPYYKFLAEMERSGKVVTETSVFSKTSKEPTVKVKDLLERTKINS